VSLLKRLSYKSRKHYDDDFDWDNYTDDSYHRRIKNDIESEFLAIAEPGDLTFDSKTGTLTRKGLGLHPNHSAILEAIGQLQPETVHEIGCGGGDHVANAQIVFPEIQTSGSDRGISQIELARQRHPSISARYDVLDATMPFSKYWPNADFVYSQAVIMHIHTAVSHFVALSNMFSMANKYVFLMENLQCHNFISEIQSLHDGGHIAWDELYIHQFEGSAGARGILCSKEKLNYPIVNSDEELRKGIKFSKRRIKRSNEDNARGIFGSKGDPK
jgi:hypothetical protein